MTADEKKQVMVKCPICKKETAWRDDNPFRPFCSERCRLIDLGKWASEEYRVPGEERPVDQKDDSDKKQPGG